MNVFPVPDAELVMTRAEIDADRPRYLIERRKGIGSSDLAALYGESRYTTPYELWLDKKYGRSKPETNSMRWGTLLEQTVADIWCLENGRVAQGGGLYRSDAFEHQLISPDFFLNIREDGRREGLEVKTANAYSKEWRNGGWPLYYQRQVEACLGVTGFDGWWLVCLIGGQDLQQRYFSADCEYIKHGVAIERWWDTHIIFGAEPSEGAPIPVEKSDGSSVEAFNPARALELRRRWDELDELGEEAAEEIKAIQQELDAEFGSGKYLTVDKVPLFQVIEKAGANKFDRKRFAKEHPDLEQQYVVQGEPQRYIQRVKKGANRAE